MKEPAMTSSSEALLSKTASRAGDVKAQAPIGVIGTGNYATALTKRLVSIGYRVMMGSRFPSRRESALILAGTCLCGAEVTSIQRCITMCDVIFVAIHMEDYKLTLGQFAHAVKNKIFVDISNRENRYTIVSNAQRLADVLPNSSVVKAFNTLAPSSLDMSVNSVTSPKVYIASDDKAAKSAVRDLAQKMGFAVVDFGDLKSALYLEDFVLRVFTRWKIPMFLTFGIFNLWCLYIIYIYFIAANAFTWEQLFLKVFNKPLCMTAISMVALTYMPGQLAAILQVYHGTKYQKFPKFLDGWLKSRKQLGIISFLLVLFHVIASTLMMSPTYYKSWYHLPEITIPANATLTSQLTLPVSTSWMVWKGEAALLLGISAFIVMSILMVTSIPSVAESLNWSEWRCVHSSMGTGFMLLSVSHVIVMGAPSWLKNEFSKTLQSITFLSIILPAFVLLSKFVFHFSPLRSYLRKIRKGWERRGASTKTSTGGTIMSRDNNCRKMGVENSVVNIDINGSEEDVALVEDIGLNWKEEKCCRCSNARRVELATPVSALDNSISNVNCGHCQCSSV